MDAQRAMELEASLLFNTYKRKPVLFESGSGVSLRDDRGREYLDFVGGLGSVVAGHAHPGVAAAVASQAAKLVQTSNLYYTSPQLELAQALLRMTFADRVFFCNSGAEANEGAIKLARKYFRTCRGEDRPEVICAFGSFHGRTLATLKATGQPERWGPFEPLPAGFTHVPYDDTAALTAALSERTCAVMLEPIQGEIGVRVPSSSFLAEARKACDEAGALLILDEVQTGMGRTGAFLAHEHGAIQPDIATMAKGLANGLPIGAVLATEEVAAAFGPGDHGTTFGGGPVPCAAGVATLTAIEQGSLIENARVRGEQLRAGLCELAADKGLDAEVRGMGLMTAIEFARPLVAGLAEDCLREGLIVNDIGTSILRFLPPLNVSEAQVGAALAIIRGCLEGGTWTGCSGAT
ncbi:MAG: acetylornithine/succinylornithine family transaminase [Candidatus Geothermincolia bacterium]